MALRYTLIAFFLAFSLAFLPGFSAPWAPAATPVALVMPVFVDPTPDPVTVACVAEVPPAVDLTANDGMGGADFEVSPVDFPEASAIDPCTGGTIVRTWTARIGMDSTVVTQNITVQPDMTGPVVSLPVINDTVACELALPTAPNNPDRYDVWISSLRIAVSTNASDNCGGSINITDNGGAPITSACTTRNVTFTLTDQCNNMTQYLASYTTIDTIAPVFIGLPQLTDTILCTEMVPMPPNVTVVDNCTPNLVATFASSSSQTANGSCTDFEYNILRTWVVRDSCGNSNIKTQIIKVVDEDPPTYTTPPDITISCASDPNDLAVTGDVTNATDNCSPNVTVAYTDQISPGICPDEMTIIRLWRATDLCGNVSGKIQIINVADLQGPSFNVPPPITVDCSMADELTVTGVPVNIMDDCDPDPDVNFTDDIFPGDCPNNYLIRRKWRVTDRCGNITEMIQEITVRDQQKPVFVQAPTDQTIICAAATDTEAAFTAWVNNRAGATASDNCTLTEDITWQIYNSGTTAAPSLETTPCPVVDQVVQLGVVDFIIIDECGLSDTITATFRVLDQSAPSLSNCPADYTVFTSSGNCTGEATLVPPVIEDGCSLDVVTETAQALATLTSQAAPGQEGEVAVDPVALDLVLSSPLPINAASPGTLTISLLSTDGEAPGEFFLVYGEDGTLLGQTTPTASQCGDGTTTFTLSVNQLNAWAADGTISLRLEPNIPVGQPQRFAINANCPGGSTARADLEFDVNLLSNIVYQYRIDNGSRVTVAPILAVDVTLDQGSHLIHYFATDCAGNTDSCSYTIVVTDNEAPVLGCPAPITVSVQPDSCQKTLTLPMPTNAADNCSVYTMYQRTLPATPAQALLSFFRDPNLNDYLPADRTLSFNDVAANAFNDVSLTIDLQGDFNTNGAFVTILGDDGSTLGTTSVGIANCNTPGQLTLTIPAATFNTWAADGLVNIQILPNDITVPPGVLGDGINPCDPMAVVSDGDTDGITFITATLSYSNLQIGYFATGASPLPEATLPYPRGQITSTFNVGTTEVFYFTADQAGNPDTCSFSVQVQDVTPPTVLCQPTNLFINPSGLQVEVVNATTVNAGSSDNCGVVDSLWLSPNIFTCDQVGQIINVTLSARDGSGNIGTCQTIVGIAPDGPMPTANSGLCGGDTLYLFANPPGPSPNVYTYRWFNPAGEPISPNGPQANLVIPGISASNEGPYRVVITGLSGCTAEGVVNVSIQSLPLTPTLQLATSICSSDAIQLTTPFVPSGAGVRFYWYRGVPPSGTLLGTSTTPMFSVVGPHTLGNQQFYLQVEANGCLSPPSELKTITVFQRPTAAVTFRDTLVCSGSVITLGANPQTGATYNWTGPNSFTANVQFPNTNTLNAANAGYYFLRVNRGLCVSAPDSTLITVKPRPAKPVLGSNSPICAGQRLTLTTSFTGASSYRWISPNGLPFTTSVPTYSVPVATAAQQGLWQLVVTLNGCDSPVSDGVGVIVHPRPAATASALPNPACQGNNVQLNGFSTVAGSSFSWAGPNNYSSPVANPTLSNITPARAGLYTLQVTTGPGCRDSTSLNISVFDNVAITGLSDNVPACIDEGFDVLVTSATMPATGNYTYQWRFNGNVVSIDPNLSIPNVTPANDGTYTLEVFTANGCSSGQSAITLDLNFVPPQPTQPVTVSGRTSFCAGETFFLTTSAVPGNDVQYYWQTPAGTITTSVNMLAVNSINVGDNGAYRVYVIRQGCASTTSPPREITVNPVPNLALTSNSPVCGGDVISLQSTFYPTGQYTWSGPGGFGNSVTVSNPIINNADSLMNNGTYRVFVSVAGCLSDTVVTNVVVRNRPMIPTVTHDAAQCLDDPDAVLTLSISPASAVPGANYTWYTQNGSVALSTPGPALQFELIDFDLFAAGGIFPFYARASFEGCNSALSNPTLVRFDTIPINSAFAGMDTTVCSGQYVLRGAISTVGSGMWTLVSPANPPGFMIANPDNANTIVSGLSAASAPYNLRWTLSNGACRNYSTDDLMLDVIVAEQALAGDDILACEDEIITLGATPASPDCRGYWTQGIAQRALGVVLVDSTSASTEVRGLSPDNVYFFTWKVECVCGTTQQTIFVNISDPNINGGPDLIVCDDQATAVLQGGSPALGSTILWRSLRPEVTLSEGQTPTPTVTNLQVGENIFVLEVDEGFCGATSRDSVTVFYKLPPVLQDDVVSVPFGEPVEVQPLGNDMIPPGTSVVLNQNPGKGTAVVVNPSTIQYTPPANFVGIAELIYTAVSEGCVPGTALITFLIGEGAECKVPSIFTPNGDDYNDKFVIPCLLDKGAYPQSQVVVFNRWGDEVYRSGKPYNSDWDGTFSGEELPADTYFYVVEPGDGSDALTGYIMIQR
jgi:gliding motility-associated-like protein